MNKETSILPQQGDIESEKSYLIIFSKPEVEIASLNSMIDVFGMDLVITPIYDKIVVVGDSEDLKLFNGLYDQILTTESVEGAFVSREIAGFLDGIRTSSILSGRSSWTRKDCKYLFCSDGQRIHNQLPRVDR